MRITSRVTKNMTALKKIMPRGMNSNLKVSLTSQLLKKQVSRGGTARLRKRSIAKKKARMNGAETS